MATKWHTNWSDRRRSAAMTTAAACCHRLWVTLGGAMIFLATLSSALADPPASFVDEKPTGEEQRLAFADKPELASLLRSVPPLSNWHPASPAVFQCHTLMWGEKLPKLEKPFRVIVERDGDFSGFMATTMDGFPVTYQSQGIILTKPQNGSKLATNSIGGFQMHAEVGEKYKYLLSISTEKRPCSVMINLPSMIEKLLSAPAERIEFRRNNELIIERTEAGNMVILRLELTGARARVCSIEMLSPPLIVATYPLYIHRNPSLSLRELGAAMKSEGSMHEALRGSQLPKLDHKKMLQVFPETSMIELSGDERKLMNAIHLSFRRQGFAMSSNVTDLIRSNCQQLQSQLQDSEVLAYLELTQTALKSGKERAKSDYPTTSLAGDPYEIRWKHEIEFGPQIVHDWHTALLSLLENECTLPATKKLIFTELTQLGWTVIDNARILHLRDQIYADEELSDDLRRAIDWELCELRREAMLGTLSTTNGAANADADPPETMTDETTKTCDCRGRPH